MNRFMKLTACCVLLGAGCQTTRGLTNWSHKDELKNAAASEELVAKLNQMSPGLTEQAAQSAASASNKSVEEYVRLGQQEIANYYNLKNSTDPSLSSRASQHLPRARENFAAALNLAPQSASAHHGLAIVADLEQNYAEAERHYLRALTQKPNDSDILGDMGYSYLLQGRLSESEQYSLRAVQANAGNLRAMKHLGDAYARQGKIKQAEEAYSKVFSPEEVQKAIAENSPKPQSDPIVKANSSIFDRLIPGKSPAQKLAEDIQRRQEEYEQQFRSQRPPVAANSAQSPQQPPQLSGRLAQESLLRAQLEAIDREPLTRRHDGPLMIDDQTGQITPIPGAEQRNLWGGGYAGGVNSPSMNPPMPSYQNPWEYRQSEPAPGAMAANPPSYSMEQYAPPAERGYEQSLSQSEQHMGTVAPAPMQQDNTRPPSGPVSPAVHPAYQKPWTGIQQAANSEQTPDTNVVTQAYQQYQYTEPTTSPILQTDAQALPGRPNPGPANRGPGSSSQGDPQYSQNTSGPNGNAPARFNGHMPGQQQPSLAPSAPMSSAGQAPQQQGAPSMPGVAPGAGASPRGNSYQDATQIAARMGMGMGPGSVFPVIQNSAPGIQPPGSMSYDPSQAPEPKRWMPDSVPPPNLNDAYQPYPKPVRPPAYTQGGQMPPQVYPSYSKEQFGTASRYDTQTMENSNIPRDYNSSMREYEAQRWQAGKEANIAVQEIWNQGPVNSPLSASAGSQYTYPNTQGMMYTPNAPGPNGIIPEQWPHAPYVSRGELQYTPEQLRQMEKERAQARTPNGPQNSAQTIQPNPAHGNNAPPLGSQLNVPLGNDQYGNNQYNVSVPSRDFHSHSLSGAGTRPALPGTTSPSGTPPVIRPQNTASLPDSGVVPTGAYDSNGWPTIIPASR